MSLVEVENSINECPGNARGILQGKLFDFFVLF